MDSSWLKEQVENAYAKLKNTSQDKYLDAFRFCLESPIQTHLRNKYLPALQTWWSNYELQTDAKNTILFYETRSDPHLAFVIYNACFYARGWSLTIFCTSNNMSYVREILGHNADRASLFLIDDICSYGGNRDAYNLFLKSRKLWSMLHDRGIEMCLTIELDAYLRDFLPDCREFDYICAKWKWSNDPGGGGLTVRRVSKILDLLDTDPYLAETILHQDIWLSTAINKYGGSVNNSLFFESYISTDPIGVHQWWTFIPMYGCESVEYYADYLTLKGLAATECMPPAVTDATTS